jgi:DNA-binding MarR family transcriptional regulator
MNSLPQQMSKISVTDNFEQALSSLKSAVSQVTDSIMWRGPSSPTRTASVSPGKFAVLAYRLRRERDQLFPGLFVDPAWDMLLDLGIAREQQRQISVSSLCIAAMCPPTTALRHLEALQKAGLICRSPDPCDKRRMFLTLSDLGTELMDRWAHKASELLQKA